MKKKVFLLVALLALLAWGGYLWRESLEWDRRVQQYDTLVEQGRRSEAQGQLESMRQDRPDDPAFLRREAFILAIEKPLQALELLHRLRASQEATWQDMALLVEISQDYAEVSIEREALLELEKNHAEKPEVTALLARQEFLDGRLEDAMQRLTKFPENEAVRLQRARILLLSPDLVSRIQAKRTLFELGKENTLIGQKALHILINREVGPGFFPEDLMEAVIGIQRHPLTGDATYLRAASLRLRLEPGRRDEILATSMENMKQRDKVLLAVWLNTELAPALVSEVLSHEDALKEEDCFHPLFQALLLLKKTTEARGLLNAADSILDAKAKIRANAYLQLAEGKKEDAFARIIRDATASGDQQTLVEVGRLALLAGNGEESWNAYLQALMAGGESIGQAVGLQLLQMALHRRETEVAWRTAKLLTERYPRRHGNRNNYAYLSLLLNRDTQAATQAAEETIKVGPGNTAFLSTLALARLKVGQLDEALALMERRGDRGLTPGERATKAAILLGLDREIDARKVAHGLQPSMMLPEEWDLLGDLTMPVTPSP